RAIAALEPELLEEPLLDRVQPDIVGQSFDRRHCLARDAAEGRDARSHGLIIDQQRAAAADALEAAVLRAAETELVADGPEQAGVGIGCQVAWIAIDDEPGHRALPTSSSRRVGMSLPDHVPVRARDGR